MNNNILTKISAFGKRMLEKVRKNGEQGVQWVGIDGLANMETAALLTIFLMLFFPAMWSMIASIIIVASKCLMDKRRGHGKECHDFICAVIGVIGGVILGTAQIALILL